jgi:hypothetical protein
MIPRSFMLVGVATTCFFTSPAWSAESVKLAMQKYCLAFGTYDSLVRELDADRLFFNSNSIREIRFSEYRKLEDPTVGGFRSFLRLKSKDEKFPIRIDVEKPKSSVAANFAIAKHNCSFHVFGAKRSVIERYVVEIIGRPVINDTGLLNGKLERTYFDPVHDGKSFMKIDVIKGQKSISLIARTYTPVDLAGNEITVQELCRRYANHGLTADLRTMCLTEI